MPRAERFVTAAALAKAPKCIDEDGPDRTGPDRIKRVKDQKSR